MSNPWFSGAFFDSLKTLFVPGEFQAIYRAYRETARVTFGSVLVFGPAKMSVAWLDMMHTEFGKLKDKLLLNINTTFDDLGTAGNKASVESDWRRWSNAHSAERMRTGLDGTIENPGAVWDALSRLAIGLDAVATNGEIEPTGVVEAFTDAGKLASDTGKAVLNAAADAATSGLKGLRSTLYVVAGIAVAGVVGYALLKGKV